MTLRRIHLILLLAVGLCQGCLLLPVPASGKNVVAGTRIRRAETKFIQPGVTTRSEAVRRLGEPFATREAPEAIAYAWTVVSWNALGVGVTGPSALVLGWGELIDRDDVLLLQFDSAHAVQRFEFSHLASRQSVQESLDAWSRAKPAPSR